MGVKGPCGNEIIDSFTLDTFRRKTDNEILDFLYSGFCEQFFFVWKLDILVFLTNLLAAKFNSMTEVEDFLSSHLFLKESFPKRCGSK